MNKVFKYVGIFLILFSCVFACKSKKNFLSHDELAAEVQGLRDMLKDSDGDDVPDYLDKEPNTPAGARVNSAGLTLDSDGDGTPDHLDKCPFLHGPASTGGCLVNEVREETFAWENDRNHQYEFWPIPKPSYLYEVPSNFIRKGETLDDINRKIREVIKSKSFRGSYMFYVRENGFVIFTELERIEDNGIISSEKIEIKTGGCNVSDLYDCYINGDPSGRYNLIAFVVSPTDFSAPDPIEYIEINTRLKQGFGRTRSSLLLDGNNNPINAEKHKVTLLVYEYVTYPGQITEFVDRSKIIYENIFFK